MATSPPLQSSQQHNDDPYKTLELHHNATQSEVRRAYKKLALKHHPDRYENHKSSSKKGREEEATTTIKNKNEAQQKMAEINEAYSILNDEERKRNYDYLYEYGGFVDDAATSAFSSANGSAGNHHNDGGRQYPYYNNNHKQEYARPFSSTFTSTASYPYTQPQNQNQYCHQQYQRVNQMRRRDSRATKKEAGKDGGFSFTFTTSSNNYNAVTGVRIQACKTTSFQNNNKYIHVETRTFFPNGECDTNVYNKEEKNASFLGHVVKSMLGFNNNDENYDDDNDKYSKPQSTKASTRSRNLHDNRTLSWFDKNFGSHIRKCIG